MDMFAQSARIATIQTTIMRTYTLAELAALELKLRPVSESFESFAAAKHEINDRGYQCAACSIDHNVHNGDQCFLHPCSGCKGKNAIGTGTIADARSLIARGRF
jgi:hypothetical protein